MSFARIIGGLLQHKMGGTAQRRLQTGIGAHGASGGLDRTLQSLLTKGSARGGRGDLATLAKDFLGRKQAGGLSGAQIGGAGALLGGLFGGGLGGAARGGAIAMLGAVALKAWREHQAQQGAAQGSALAEEASEEEADALTAPETERLVLRAMIGAAQADGHIDEAEMERILGRMGDDGVTEEERREAREEAARPVDVEAIGRAVSRPEVATEVYLAALLAIEIDTEAERAYLRRLATALRLDAEMVRRLHRMTGAPAP